MALTEAKMSPELKPFLLEDVRRTGKQLGVGSYGVVEELRVGGAVCAGKKLHETLMDPGIEGVRSMLERFASECQLMANLRHPHVVQFLGLCFLPGVTAPFLVMERMDTNLAKVLVNQDIPYSLKRSILLDISRGLFYLHGHSPPIIHRDLTARNILFTPSMLAKIADLGNARMVEPHKLNKTMSTAPGTLVYMPPEAIGVQPKYDAKLDIFSFGHLSLYTAIKEFPDDLLPSTYPDPNNSDSLKARSEVQRREPYMVKLYKEFGKEHSLVKLIRQCLHNAPKCRPSAADVMELLEGLDVEKEVEDPYNEYEGMNRLEMVQLLKSKEKKEAEPPPPLASPAPPQPAQPAQPRLPSPPAMLQAEDSLHMRVGQIQRGTPSMMAKYKSGMRKGWKTYIFKISNKTHIQYLDKNTDKPHGEQLLSLVTSVDIPPPIKGSKFPFAVHFSNKGSPWIINAFSEEERKSWMEAIHPGSTSQPQVPKPLALYEVIPDDLLQGDIYEGLALNPAEETTADPPTWLGYEAKLYAYFDPDEQPARQDYPILTKPNPSYIHLSGSEFLPLLTSDHTDEKNSYSGPTYECPFSPSLVRPPPSPPPTPPIQPPPLPSRPPPTPPIQPPPIQPPPPPPPVEPPPPPPPPIQPPFQPPPPPVEPPPPPPPPIQPPFQPPPPPVEPPPLPPKAKDHSSLAQRALQYLDPAQLDIMIQMLQKLKGEPGPTALPCPTLPLPMKKDDEFYEDIYDMDKDDGLYEDITSLDMSSAVEAATAPQIPPPLPPDRLQVSGRQIFTPKVASFRKQFSHHQETNFELLLKRATVTSDRMLVVEEEEDEVWYEPRPEWAKATTQSGDTLSSLSALQQEALYIPQSALSGLEPIGEGQFGKVYKANLKRDVKEIKVAVKTIQRYTSEKETQDFMHEMSIMADMMHPNIIRLYGLVSKGRPGVPAPWMVLEYLPHGDLKKFLTTYSRPVEQLVKYMIDVAMGMHYLAEKGLVHRDLAARNVIVGKNELCKVADFGLLRELPPDDSIYHSKSDIPCPVRWMAPESIQSRAFSTASDVWSFGILQWEMFYPDRVPYQNMESMECAVNVARGCRLHLPRKSPPVVRRVMKACWQHNPVKRPSFLLISTLLSTKVVFGQ